MSLTKAELTEELCNLLHITRQRAKAFLELFFEEIVCALGRGEPVKLIDFGSLILRDKKARPGRNPKTKEEATITARRVVTFRMSQKLRAKLKDRARRGQ